MLAVCASCTLTESVAPAGESYSPKSIKCEESGFHAHVDRLIALSLGETDIGPPVRIGNGVKVLSYCERYEATHSPPRVSI